ncbi:hypothetical protein [Mycolicibacterium mucogenicum]|uniref:hypothetical protein n=1 Tax=Mycolicibacterium mucogenicum TaxID=56689 RepID=UPI000A4D7A01|nr:hypothetical protein [Mycolicibacterium mucogenicum]
MTQDQIDSWARKLLRAWIHEGVNETFADLFLTDIEDDDDYQAILDAADLFAAEVEL